jgi:hypothetical protein
MQKWVRQLDCRGTLARMYCTVVGLLYLVFTTRVLLGVLSIVRVRYKYNTIVFFTVQCSGRFQ